MRGEARAENEGTHTSDQARADERGAEVSRRKSDLSSTPILHQGVTRTYSGYAASHTRRPTFVWIELGSVGRT